MGCDQEQSDSEVIVVSTHAQVGDGASNSADVGEVNTKFRTRPCRAGKPSVQVAPSVYICRGHSAHHSRGSEAPRVMAPRLFCIEISKRNVLSTTPERMQCATTSTLTAAAIAEDPGIPERDAGFHGFSAWRSNFPLQRARGGRSRVGLPAQKNEPCGTNTTKHGG